MHACDDAALKSWSCPLVVTGTSQMPRGDQRAALALGSVWLVLAPATDLGRLDQRSRAVLHPGECCLRHYSAGRRAAVQGQAEDEHRSAAGVVAGLDVPAVQLGVL